MAILPISLTILCVVCMPYGVGKVHGLHGPRVEIKGNYVDWFFSPIFMWVLGLELRASGLAEDAFPLNHLTSPTLYFLP